MSLSRPGPLVIIALAAALALVTAARSTPEAPGASTPTASAAVGAVPTGITTPGQIERPIDAYLLDADQIIATETMRIRTADECMVAKGYPDADVRADGDLAASISLGVRERVVVSDLYGFFDSVDVARATGYLAGDGLGGSYAVTWQPTIPTSVSDACFAQASTAAGAADVLLLTTPAGLPDGGPTIPSSDPAYTDAVERWSQCMSERGYSYDDPQAAVGDTKWQQDRMTSTASAAQIATATADVECKISTNLIGVAVAVQDAYDQQYIDAHADALSAYKSALLSAVHAAAA